MNSYFLMNQTGSDDNAYCKYSYFSNNNKNILILYFTK